MASEEQINAAGLAYWNYYRKESGLPLSKPFKLDRGFADAMNAAIDAALAVGKSEKEGDNGNPG
jgi:hypothetical protein